MLNTRAGLGRVGFHWDWRDNFIVVRFSRAALQSPRWVRVTARLFQLGARDYFVDWLLDGAWTARVYADSSPR